MTEPSAPVELGFYDTGCSARGLDVSNGLAYVADGYDGLWVLSPETVTGIQLPLPPRTHLMAAYPNPLNPKTVIELLLNEAGQTKLSVHDAMGRQVAMIYSGWLDVGNHLLEWNGTDKSGQHAPSGVYFLRLNTRSSTEAMRLVIIR